VVKKSSIFWDITPCSPFKVNQRFGRTCRIHLQGQRITHLFYAGFSLGLFFDREDEGGSVLWDIMPCNLFQFNRHFEECCLYLQDRRVRHLLTRWFLAWLVLLPWRRRRYDLPKCRLTLNGLHLVTTRKIEFFVVNMPHAMYNVQHNVMKQTFSPTFR
jgi:hypothetical protein